MYEIIKRIFKRTVIRIKVEAFQSIIDDLKGKANSRKVRRRIIRVQKKMCLA